VFRMHSQARQHSITPRSLLINKSIVESKQTSPSIKQMDKLVCAGRFAGRAVEATPTPKINCRRPRNGASQILWEFDRAIPFPLRSAWHNLPRGGKDDLGLSVGGGAGAAIRAGA
jgi:hypothetical protein